MAVVRDSRSALVKALEAPELDVLDAATSIAFDEYPDLDPEAPRREIERLAREVRDRLSDTTKVQHRLQVLSEVLGGENQFVGNAADYSDPRNSYINEVLTRRVGIPITLSLVYQEVAQRCGIPVYPVAFPGHFLIAARDDTTTWVLDPFHGGRFLRSEDLRVLLARTAPSLTLSPQLVRPAQPRQVVARMLSNLKHLYLSTEDFPRALRIVELLLVVAPGHPGELRARAGVLQSLGDYRAALDDVQHCLALSPNAPDATVLRWTAHMLASRPTWRN